MRFLRVGSFSHADVSGPFTMTPKHKTNEQNIK